MGCLTSGYANVNEFRLWIGTKTNSKTESKQVSWSKSFRFTDPNLFV